MGRSSLLTSADLRSALIVAHEACELPAGSQERREHGMRGLAKLVSAQVGVLAELDRNPGLRLTPALDFGWAGERERSIFLDYTREHSEALDDPTAQRLMQLPQQPVVTVRRQELIENSSWYRCAHAQELRRAAGIDAFIYSGWFGNGRTHALSLHRAWGDKPFSERDRALVDAFHSGALWLHQEEPRSDRLQELSPRERSVLDGLSRGLSEKQVAAELNLSAHTVHDYVKALHKKLHVQSRGELLAVALHS